MAEVHEITRTAFNQLLRNCADDRDFSGREWVVVEAFVEFGRHVTPWHLHFFRNIQSETDAQTMAAALERINIHDIQDGDPMSECEIWHVVDDEPEVERPDYYRVDMEGKGSAHFTEYEQACEFVDYMMHRPLGDSWCTFCEVWACWSDGSESWLGDHWRSVFDGRVFHMRDCDALAKHDLI